MADVVSDRVIVELEAKLDRYNSNVASAEQKFDRAMGNIQKSAGRAEAFVSRSIGLIAGAFAGISTIAVARSFLEIADQAKNLDAQLRLATQSSGSFAQAQEDVRRISNEARVGLEETAALYGTFLRNSRELGISQREAARATETISKAFQISGATAAEAAGGLRQLLQGIQSGTLRGEELNSVLENAPRLARALADGLGVTIGQLRAMGQEGQLTGRKVLDALEKASGQIDAEFRELPVTFDQAMTRISNAAVITFGAFDRGGEFSTALANFISDGTDGFAELERKAEDFGIEVRGTLEGLASAFAPIIEAGEAAFGALGNGADDLRSRIRPLLAEIDAISKWLAQQGALGAALTGNFDNYQNGRTRTGTNLAGRFDAAAAASDMERRFNRQIRILEASQSRDAGAAGATSSTTGSSKKGAKAKRSPLDPEAFAREEAALNDQILRLKQDEIVDAEAKAAIEQERIEKARAATVAEVRGEKRYTDAQKQIVIALVNQAAALEQAKAIRERDIQLAKEALDARLATLTNDRDLLRAQGDLADTREQRRAIELRLLDLAYQQERAELDAVIASKDATAAQKAIAQQRRDILDQLQGAEAAGINRRYESPLERYRRNQNATSTQDQVEELVGQELDYVRDGIRDSITKRLGIKDPLLSGIIEMFIQKAIIGPITDALLSGIGGGGGVIGAISGFLGFAGGGSMTIGGRGGSDRNLLSLNGRPIANVSRGETLSVGNKTLGRSGGGATIVQQITIDARNSVTPDGFAREILAITGQQAIHAAAGMGQTVIKGVPTRLAQFQRDGT